MSVTSEVTWKSFWRCAVPSCRPRWEARIPTKLFSVPSECERLQAWLEVCPFLRTYDMREPQNIKLCKLHFTPDSFDDIGRLTPDAIPTLRLPKKNNQLFMEITPIESSSTSYLIQTRSENSYLSSPYGSIDSAKIISCRCGAMFPDKEMLHAHMSKTRKTFFKRKGDEYNKYDALKSVQNKVKAGVINKREITHNTVVNNKPILTLNPFRSLDDGNLSKTTNTLKMNATIPEFKIPNKKYVLRNKNSLLKSNNASKLYNNITNTKCNQDIDMQTDNVMYTIVKKNKQSIDYKETDCNLEQEEYEIVVEKCPPIEESSNMNEDHKQPIKECIKIDDDTNRSVKECNKILETNDQPVEEHTEIIPEYSEPVKDCTQIDIQNQPTEQQTEILLENDQLIKQYSETVIENEEHAKIGEENIHIFEEHSYSINKHTET